MFPYLGLDLWGGIELGERVKNRREQDCGGGGWRGFILVRGHGSSCALEALRCRDVKDSYRTVCFALQGLESSGRERRRREGHEVSESVADIVVDRDCGAGRKMAGDCTVSRCRFAINTLEMQRQRVAHGLAHMTREQYTTTEREVI